MSDSIKLEKHHVHYDMRPQGWFEHKGFKVYIAEGGPKYEYTNEVTKDDCPHGYYDVIFTVEKGGKALFEVPLYIDALQYLEKGWNPDTFKKARYNAAKAAAMIHVDELHKALKVQ